MNVDLDKRLVSVLPHRRQAEHQMLEFYAFVHFTVNTYTGWSGETEQRMKAYLTRQNLIPTSG